MINLTNFEKALTSFGENSPFDHVVIDDFFEAQFANILAEEFLDYNDDKWFSYKNKIENKKALNDWNLFPAHTYEAFTALNSPAVTERLEKKIGKKIFIDNGLHGGGWHIHGKGGNLNPHLDYSIHPKLGLQRKLNIIIYLSKELKPEHGGHLGLWSGDAEKCNLDDLQVKIEPKFNRAVLFDTTQSSWHGMAIPLNVPEDVYRKSLAIYYLCTPTEDAARRGRALFSPRIEQKNDQSVQELISKRADVSLSEQVYREE